MTFLAEQVWYFETLWNDPDAGVLRRLYGKVNLEILMSGETLIADPIEERPW